MREIEQKPRTGEQFVGERITPVPGALDFSSSAPGEPALPMEFTWRGEQVKIREVSRRWKSASGCRGGSNEQYVRKHWYEIQTTDGRQMKIYFDRQARSRRQRKSRWWLYSIARCSRERERAEESPGP